MAGEQSLMHQAMLTKRKEAEYHPQPTGQLRRKLIEALLEFREARPKLYRVHEEAFRELLKPRSLELIREILIEMWRGSTPNVWRRTLQICIDNELSRWTYLCVKLVSLRDGSIHRIGVLKLYRPEKGYSHTVKIKTGENPKAKLERYLAMLRGEG